MDARLKNISYSSLLDLHGCPRLFQLKRLQAERSTEDYESSVTFAFGHLVGEGIQMILEGASLDEVYQAQFLKWEPDLFAENQKQRKSFWTALFAVEKFAASRAFGMLEDWELVYWEGKPAVELSFRIALPDGFYYRGFVDAVLQNTQTGEVRVLEVKTTSAKDLHPAMYKNSAQGIGYSIVLDVLFPELSSYSVLYLPYKTHAMEYEPLEFKKSYLQRALWIRELLLDVEILKMYEDSGVYPMRGEYCYSFRRECPYFGTCTLDTASLIDPEAPEKKEEVYQIELSLDDLIQAQLRKVS